MIISVVFFTNKSVMGWGFVSRKMLGRSPQTDFDYVLRLPNTAGQGAHDGRDRSTETARSS